MATQLQIRRGTSTQVAAFTGAEGEIVVNTTNDSVHVNDGSTAGGFELARADLNNVSDTSLNAALTGNTVSALTITTLTLGSTAITATGTEINLLDGVTATTAELNYVDGVTSAIQTQIDAKAPLASPTFTGTVTADGLTVDTNTLVVDATNNRVGIGTSTVNRALEIAGNNNGGAKANYIRITDTDTSATANNQQGGIEFFTNDVTAGISASMEVLYAGSGGGGEITFNTNASSSGTLTEALRIDSSQNVGIGTSPSTTLEIANTGNGTAGPILRLTNPDVTMSSNQGIGAIEFFNSDATGLGARVATNIQSFAANTSGGGYLTFGVSPNAGTVSEAMRIDSAGNVGIGTNSPNEPLHIFHATRNVLVNIESGDAKAFISFKDNSTTNTDTVFLGADGNNMAFYAGSAGSERMRIDSSGNLLVGTTDTNPTTGTSEGIVLGAGGIMLASNTSDAAIALNRTSTDGDIAIFKKDGTKVGSIGVGTASNYLAIGNTNSSIQFYASGIVPATGSPSVLSDNTKDIGAASVRWDDIYATNGTIQTSDRNEKQDIEALSDAEQRVAVAAKGLLRKFRWISSVEENGDDARIHFGIIAQDLQAAFEAEGLDAGRYAMFINSTWTDEDGNEQTRLGVRYSELLAFIISAI